VLSSEIQFQKEGQFEFNFHLTNVLDNERSHMYYGEGIPSQGKYKRCTFKYEEKRNLEIILHTSLLKEL
jgi:hypothetical protein